MGPVSEGGDNRRCIRLVHSEASGCCLVELTHACHDPPRPRPMAEELCAQAGSDGSKVKFFLSKVSGSSLSSHVARNCDLVLISAPLPVFELTDPCPQADTIGSGRDRQKVLVQIAQNLFVRPALQKVASEIPTIFIPRTGSEEVCGSSSWFFGARARAGDGGGGGLCEKCQC